MLADGHTHITTWRETHRYLRAEHDVHYIFPYARERRCFTDQATLIKKVKWPGLAFAHFWIAGFFAFLKLNRRLQPDVVIFDQFTALYSLILGLRKRKPLLLLDLRQAKYSNNSRWFSGSLFRAYTRCVLKLNRRYHDGITFISDGLRQQLLKDMAMPLHENYLIWPSGVDPEIFDPHTVSSSGETPGTLRLFFHGSVTADRGLAESIKALALLKNSDLRFTFTVVGNGPYLAQLKRLAIELKIADRMRFLDPVPYEEVPRLIADADVCMMPYPINEYWEGNVPIKILEYMAMQKVVLCTELKVFRAISQGSSCAWFIENNSPELIAEALRHLSRNSNILPAWGKIGREIVRTHYTWQAISGNINRFLTQTAIRKTRLADR